MRRLGALATVLAALVLACGSSDSGGVVSTTKAGAGGSAATSASSSATSTTVASSTTAAAGSDSGYGGGYAVPTSSTTASSASTSLDATGASQISIELDDFYLKPDTIVMKAGQRLQVELENQGKSLHNFSVPSMGLDQDVKPGEKMTVRIELAADASSVGMFCKYHQSRGMKGQLTKA
jgi:plastocyanin